MTPRLKKLLIECHPDRHGGDHSRMEEYFLAAQRPPHGAFRCVDCSTTVTRKGTRCGICYQAKRRQRKVLPVAAFILLLCVLGASVANAQPMPPRVKTLAAPVVSTNQPFAATLAPALPAAPSGNFVVNLAWERSPDAGVTGYRIYQGVESGIYTNSFAVGNRTNASAGKLRGGVSYRFTATAYDASGTESPFSNEVEFTPQSIGTLQIAAWRYSNAGTPGQTNEILESADMKTWRVLKTFVGDGTEQAVTATNGAAAYYRVRLKGQR